MELTFKAVYWAESGYLELGGRQGHKVVPLYRALGPNWKRVVDDCVQDSGWTDGGILATYIDDVLNHVERRYFGVDKQGKSAVLNIPMQNRIRDLRKVQRQLGEKIGDELSSLEPPTAIRWAPEST